MLPMLRQALNVPISLIVFCSNHHPTPDKTECNWSVNAKMKNRCWKCWKAHTLSQENKFLVAVELKSSPCTENCRGVMILRRSNYWEVEKKYLSHQAAPSPFLWKENSSPPDVYLFYCSFWTKINILTFFIPDCDVLTSGCFWKYRFIFFSNIARPPINTAATLTMVLASSKV